MLLLGSLQVFWFTGIHRRCKLFQICLKYKGFIKFQEKKAVPIKPMGIFPLAVLCQDFKWVFNLAKKMSTDDCRISSCLNVLIRWGLSDLWVDGLFQYLIALTFGEFLFMSNITLGFFSLMWQITS